MGIAFGHLEPQGSAPVYHRGETTIQRATDYSPSFVDYVIDRIRDRDLHEFTSVGSDPRVTGPRMIRHSAHAFMAFHKSRPTFVFGTAPTLPHVHCIWGFGTDDTRRAVPGITGFIQDVFIPQLQRSGVTRVEVRLPASYRESRRWLEHAFGLEVETYLPGYSTTGEPYVQMARQHIQGSNP